MMVWYNFIINLISLHSYIHSIDFIYENILVFKLWFRYKYGKNHVFQPEYEDLPSKKNRNGLNLYKLKFIK